MRVTNVTLVLKKIHFGNNRQKLIDFDKNVPKIGIFSPGSTTFNLGREL